jgi:SAM-dependent methyltransferase
MLTTPTAMSHMEALQAFLDQHLPRTGRLHVLEAGCGSAGHIRIGSPSYVVGIDISASQLERNAGLDEKILGDIQTYRFPEHSFDLVVCWEVLEHLAEPEKALDSFFRATKPGGLIVIAVPNVRSVKGLITKLTPHAFHVWFYRTLLNHQTAGMPGHPPFPTYMRATIAPDALQRRAAQRGVSLRYADYIEAPKQRELRQRLHLSGRAWEVLAGAIRTLSIGLIEPELTECILVLQA